MLVYQLSYYYLLLLQANPKFRLIKGKSLYHLNILREIYDKDIATRAQAESTREKVRRWEREMREMREMSIDEIDEMQANNISSFRELQSL